MRSIIKTTFGALLTSTLLALAHCGPSMPSSEQAADVGALATPIAATALFHPTSTLAAPPSGLAFDRSPYVPQAYDGAPSGTATYGVFTAGPRGVDEWFATSSGSHAASALDAVAIGSLGIEYSATLGAATGDDAIVAVSEPTGTRVAGGGLSYVEQVYRVSFASDALSTAEVTTLGGPLPLPLGTAIWPSVVAVSGGSARLVIAGEGQCCPGGASCGGTGEPPYENFVYLYAPDASKGDGVGESGVSSWSYVADASAKHPACAIGLAIDNSNSGDNVPGETTFVLYADGSVQPWLTSTPLWGRRSSWKIAGAKSIAAYNQRVAILDSEGNLFSADAYDDVAPKLVLAAGASQECGGKANAVAFDVTDPAARGNLLVLMQDMTAGGAPVVCSIPAKML